MASLDLKHLAVSTGESNSTAELAEWIRLVKLNRSATVTKYREKVQVYRPLFEALFHEKFPLT
ncbi:hypothetical protein [Paenibacillus senegalensis]|uniref:hypothetical protein n=1 Tax=Paenibacillus senegalensis TaxID=1465766 RepID=UPI0002884870|nr:hypothetical protein [Paenibacillus senegalensis]